MRGYAYEEALADMEYRTERRRIIELPKDFPEVVVLCGSTKFKDLFESENFRLTSEGRVVLSVGRYGHLDGLDMGGELKKKLDELHFRKIELADRAHIINAKQAWCPRCQCWCGDHLTVSWTLGDDRIQHTPDRLCRHSFNPCGEFVVMKPYVGESTRREIDYALSLGKPVTYLNPPDVS